MMCGICKGTLFAYDEAAKVAYIGSKIEFMRISRIILVFPTKKSFDRYEYGQWAGWRIFPLFQNDCKIVWLLQYYFILAV